jgi:hypothetical protein
MDTQGGSRAGLFGQAILLEALAATVWIKLAEMRTIPSFNSPE